MWRMRTTLSAVSLTLTPYVLLHPRNAPTLTTPDLYCDRVNSPQPASPAGAPAAAAAPVAGQGGAQHWPTLGDSKEVPPKKKKTSAEGGSTSAAAAAGAGSSSGSGSNSGSSSGGKVCDFREAVVCVHVVSGRGCVCMQGLPRQVLSRGVGHVCLCVCRGSGNRVQADACNRGFCVSHKGRTSRLSNCPLPLVLCQGRCTYAPPANCQVCCSVAHPTNTSSPPAFLQACSRRRIYSLLAAYQTGLKC